MTSPDLTTTFRLALLRVSDVLTRKNVQDLAFLCDEITPTEGEQINDATELFAAMQRLGLINERKVDVPIEYFDDLHLSEASNLLKEYRRTHLLSDTKIQATCPVHADLPLKYFCTSCDTTVCPDCVIASHGRSKDCDVIDLDKIKEEITERLEKLDQKIEGAVAVADSWKQLWEEKKSSSAEYRDVTRKEAAKDYSSLVENAGGQKRFLVEQLSSKELSDSELLLEEKKQLLTLEKRVDQLERTNKNSSDDSLREYQKILRATKEIDEIHTKMEELQEVLKERSVGIVYRKVGNDGVFGVVMVSTLVGSVFIAWNEIVHIFDGRQANIGILLISVDPSDSTEEHWRRPIKVHNNTSPLVVSCLDMRPKDTVSNIVFAVGKVVHIVCPKAAYGSGYNGVDTITPVEIGDVPEGSWITNVTAHHPSADTCDEFLISVHNSKTIREYNVTGEALRAIDVTGFVLSSGITCVAYCKNTFAIVGRERGDVILLSYDGTLKQCGSLCSPSAGLIPAIVISTSGKKWLVLWIGAGAERAWRITSYAENGALLNSSAEGTASSDVDVPVSITRFRNTACATLSNRTIRSFEY